MAQTDFEPRTEVPDGEGGSRRWLWITAVVLAVPLLAGAWWLVRPALVDDRVDTEFPVSIEDAQSTTSGGDDEQADAAADEADEADDAAAGDVRDPMDGGAVVPDAEDTSQQANDDQGDEADDGDAQAAEDAPASTETAEPAEPEGPQLLGRGSFVGLDNHDATGDAALFQQPDGSYVVRLEEIDVDNGPGLQLHVVPGRDQSRPSDGSFIAPLQGNQGNQTYELPADFTPSDELTILIWCEPFTTAVGGATLAR